MCGISDVHYCSQGSSFWPATKVKSKHKTVVCDHGENTTQSMATSSKEKMTSIPCHWKIAAKSSEIYALLPLVKDPYYVLEIHHYNELIFFQHQSLSEKKQRKQLMLPKFSLFKEIEVNGSKRESSKKSKRGAESLSQWKNTRSHHLAGILAVSQLSLPRNADSLSF